MFNYVCLILTAETMSLFISFWFSRVLEL